MKAQKRFDRESDRDALAKRCAGQTRNNAPGKKGRTTLGRRAGTSAIGRSKPPLSSGYLSSQRPSARDAGTGGSGGQGPRPPSSVQALIDTVIGNTPVTSAPGLLDTVLEASKALERTRQPSIAPYADLVAMLAQRAIPLLPGPLRIPAAFLQSQGDLIRSLAWGTDPRLGAEAAMNPAGWQYTAACKGQGGNMMSNSTGSVPTHCEPNTQARIDDLPIPLTATVVGEWDRMKAKPPVGGYAYYRGAWTRPAGLTGRVTPPRISSPDVQWPWTPRGGSGDRRRGLAGRTPIPPFQRFGGGRERGPYDGTSDYMKALNYLTGLTGRRGDVGGPRDPGVTPLEPFANGKGKEVKLRGASQAQRLGKLIGYNAATEARDALRALYKNADPNCTGGHTNPTATKMAIGVAKCWSTIGWTPYLQDGEAKPGALYDLGANAIQDAIYGALGQASAKGAIRTGQSVDSGGRAASGAGEGAGDMGGKDPVSEVLSAVGKAYAENAAREGNIPTRTATKRKRPPRRKDP